MGVAGWRDWRLPEVQTVWTERETILYALGVGCGMSGDDDLRFIRSFGAEALPSMASVLGAPGAWFTAPEYCLDPTLVLHGEHGLKLHRPIPAAGNVIGRSMIAGVHDRGAGKGVAMQIVRELTDVEGTPVATVSDVILFRGDRADGVDSGFRPPRRPPMPDRAPDLMRDQPTSAQTAHIYRLSGDTNPLHWDPGFAANAGYPRPVLQGLATAGNITRALVALLCNNDPARLKALSLRFTAVAFPGDTIRTEVWREKGIARFRGRALERDIIVVDFGEVDIDERG